MHSHLSILMLDIDFFKMINDRYGHQVGDRVLKKLGAILKNALRMTDICGRYGGEEFILILPNTDIQQAEFVVEKLRKKIWEANFECGKITVSIGISEFPTHINEYEMETTMKKQSYN